MRRLLLVIAFTVLLASIASAQQTWQLPRITSTTGLNDSALWVGCDSLRPACNGGKAISGAQARKMLALKSWDSLITSVARFTGTVYGTPTWASAQTFATGQKVDSATGAARAQKLTTARTIGGTSFDGTANISVALADSATGATRAQKLTTARTIGGTSFDGTANIVPGTATLAGGLTGTPDIAVGTVTLTSGSWIKEGSAFVLSGDGTFTAIRGGSTSGVTLQSADGLNTNVQFKNGGGMTFRAGRDSLLAGSALAFAANDTVFGAPYWNSTQTFSATPVSIDLFGTVRAGDGTATLPGHGFGNENGIGMYRPATGLLRLMAGSTVIQSMASTIDSTFVPLAGHVGSASLPQFTFYTDPNTGLYSFGADTLGLATGGVHSLRLSGGASPTLAGGAGNMTIQAGTGASRTLLFNTTSAGSASLLAMRLNALQQAEFHSGSAGTPSVALSIDNTDAVGLYASGSGTSDTLHIAVNGNRGLSVTGNGSSAIVGGAGNMTIQAGTGASRTLTLQTTTSGGTAQNTLVLGADSSATFLGAATIGTRLSVGTSVTTNSASGDAIIANARDYRAVNGAGSTTFSLIRLSGGDSIQINRDGAGIVAITGKVAVSDTLTANGKVRVPSLTAATATQRSACVDATTKELLENAASSCLVSSVRFKKNIRPLSADTAWRIVRGARPITFEYKANGQKRIGPGTAEQADSLDHRLASLDGKGQPNSINLEGYVAALLVVVEHQQKQIDSLGAAILYLSSARANRTPAKATALSFTYPPKGARIVPCPGPTSNTALCWTTGMP